MISSDLLVTLLLTLLSVGLNKQKRDAAVEVQASSDASGGDPSVAPAPALSATQADRHALILELWRQLPGLGPSRIRGLLKRKGFKASVNTVRAVMEEHGYVQPKVRRKEHAGRYEAVRPL